MTTKTITANAFKKRLARHLAEEAGLLRPFETVDAA